MPPSTKIFDNGLTSAEHFGHPVVVEDDGIYVAEADQLFDLFGVLLLLIALMRMDFLTLLTLMIVRAPASILSVSRCEQRAFFLVCKAVLELEFVLFHFNIYKGWNC